ncbi:MAG: DUF4830 domain-containing protein [Oscillospiraceae bacterium]|nr:DUF4830 domain-containing protein [Oscillospiraceae bacterium]
MMVMTAKVDMKKIMLILIAVAALILAMILLMGGGEEAETTAAPAVSNNDGRVQFLKDFGWDVTTSPAETSQVKIPEATSEVFERYNNLQKSQGYDLTDYAGKTVMRFVYKINNYPGATEPVYATLLVYKNKVIGGDVTDTAAGGKIQSFKMPQESEGAEVTN